MLRAISAELAAVLVVWGCILVNPGEGSFARSPVTFAIAEQFMPEWAWGAIALLIGLVQLGTTVRMRVAIWSRVSILGAAFWMFFATSVLLSNPASIAWPVYATLAVLEATIVIGLARFGRLVLHVR